MEELEEVGQQDPQAVLVDQTYFKSVATAYADQLATEDHKSLDNSYSWQLTRVPGQCDLLDAVEQRGAVAGGQRALVVLLGNLFSPFFPRDERLTGWGPSWL